MVSAQSCIAYCYQCYVLRIIVVPVMIFLADFIILTIVSCLNSLLPVLMGDIWLECLHHGYMQLWLHTVQTWIERSFISLYIWPGFSTCMFSWFQRQTKQQKLPRNLLSHLTVQRAMSLGHSKHTSISQQKIPSWPMIYRRTVQNAS